jgi:hypothetical protein
MVINRLPVRADQVYVQGCQPGLAKRLYAGAGEEVSQFEVQLGDRADVEPLDIKDPPSDLGLVRLFSVMQQVDRGPRAVSAGYSAAGNATERDVDGISTGPGDHTNHDPAWLPRQGVQVSEEEIHFVLY